MKQKPSSISLLLITATTLIFSGCASDVGGMRDLSPVDPEFVPSRLDRPDPLARSRAEVGDVMLTAGEFDYQPDSSRYESINIEPQPDLTVKHKRYNFNFPLRSGPYKLIAESGRGKFYRYIDPIGSRRAYGGLFVPAGQEVATDFFWWWYRPGGDEAYVPPSVHSAKLHGPIDVRHGEYLQPIDGVNLSSGPTATLTYAGVARGQIKFVYKEFTARGMARPAFTQEVSLDYIPGETYAYKKARFIVHEAGTTHILYTLLEGL